MIRLVLTGAALLMHTSLASAACTCARLTLDELIARGSDDVVFSARVASVLAPEKGKPAVVRLTVDDVIKGDVPRVVEMSGVTPEDDPCGVDFRPGEVRTLAAYKKDGRWHTDICHVPRL